MLSIPLIALPPDVAILTHERAQAAAPTSTALQRTPANPAQTGPDSDNDELSPLAVDGPAQLPPQPPNRLPPEFAAAAEPVAIPSPLPAPTRAVPPPIAQADNRSFPALFDRRFNWPSRPAESFDPESDLLEPTRSPDLTPLEAEETAPVLPPAELETPASTTPAIETQVAITTLQVQGSSIFEPAAFEPIVAPLSNRTVSPTELRAASDAVTQLYLNQGYITSRAMDPVIADDGSATIQVVEGRLAAIEINGTQRVSQDYIRDRIALAAQIPLNPNQLEEQLKLLRSDPLFSEFTASLRAGENLGESILAVELQESKSVIGEVKLDNASPPSIGADAFDTQLAYRNLTGGGDELSLGYRVTRTGGLQQLRWGYRIPVNARQGTVSLSGDRSWTEITQDEFEAFGIRGESERYQLTYRQPLIRRPRQELALSAGFKFQNGQTFLFNDLPTPFGLGPDEDGVSRTSVLQLGQDYVKRDPGGAWALRSQFNLGLGLFDATQNPDDLPDGQFFSWLGQVQRVQRLTEDHLLLFLAELQLTPHSLLPSEQFTIGGAQSLRGYRQNLRSGDNGFRLSLEDRITLRRDKAGASTLLLTPFVEVGKVWNTAHNPNQLSRQTLLASTGLGLIWQPRPAVSLRLDYGLPLISPRDDGDSLQDQGIHFSASYRF